MLASRNVPGGGKPVLGVPGGLPPGTLAAAQGWLACPLEDYRSGLHLVHPLQCKAITSARLTNYRVGAAILAQLLRADLLPEAWIARAVRQLRALLQHRIQPVRPRTLLRGGLLQDALAARAGHLIDHLQRQPHFSRCRPGCGPARGGAAPGLPAPGRPAPHRPGLLGRIAASPQHTRRARSPGCALTPIWQLRSVPEYCPPRTTTHPVFGKPG